MFGLETGRTFGWETGNPHNYLIIQMFFLMFGWETGCMFGSQTEGTRIETGCKFGLQTGGTHISLCAPKS